MVNDFFPNHVTIPSVRDLRNFQIALKSDAPVILLSEVHIGNLKSLTEKTHQLIGRRQLEMMKPSAVLINTARSGLIDEKALVECLQEGGIAGAALDVFIMSPCPNQTRSCIWTM